MGSIFTKLFAVQCSTSRGNFDGRLGRRWKNDRSLQTQTRRNSYYHSHHMIQRTVWDVGGKIKSDLCGNTITKIRTIYIVDSNNRGRTALELQKVLREDELRDGGFQQSGGVHFPDVEEVDKRRIPLKWRHFQVLSISCWWSFPWRFVLSQTQP